MMSVTLVDDISAISATCLTGLYLRGGPRPQPSPPRRWSWVDHAIRRTGATLSSASSCLRDAGLRTEALLLEAPGVLTWAEALVSNGRVCTPSDADYPKRWLEHLGNGAPAALWRVGRLPGIRYLGVVGSRCVDDTILALARDVGASASKLGFAVVSGGAAGCDRAAVDGATQGLELLPYGISHATRDHPALSLCEPEAPFSRAAAMERNALIYAASEAAVIVHARYRQGGTWVGATDALRRKLCPLLVCEQPESQAHDTLIALGCVGLPSAGGLAAALSRSHQLSGLFQPVTGPPPPVDFSYHEGVGRG